MTPNEILIERTKTLNAARALSEKAEKESRDLLAEEQTKYDELLEQVVTLGKRADRMVEEQRIADELEASRPKPIKPDPEDRGSGAPVAPAAPLEARVLEKLLERGWLPPEAGGFNPSRYEAYRSAARGELKSYGTQEYRDAIGAWIRGGRPQLGQEEARALQVDQQTLGGALVAPVQFQQGLIQAVDDAVYLRAWGTVISVVAAQSLGMASLDADPADADWTHELGTGSEDSAMAFGKRELIPHPLAKRLKVSQKLLRLNPSSESLVRDRLGFKFGVTMEKAGLTGTGAGQPLGVMVASNDGIPTSRDVSTDMDATAITFDGLHEVKFALKGAYHARARWLFHRDAIKQIAKLKDGNGDYIWRENTRVTEPSQLLGIPTFMSEFMLNTFTSGSYVGILGDFSNYWWADALGMTIQRLDELYAEAGQVGFIGKLESDGMPILAEAFVRVKLG